MPVRRVSAAGRYLLRGLLCQLGNGANKATWRLSGSCYTITVGRKGEARLLPAAWLSRRGWERLCFGVCSQGQDAGVAKGWGSPPTDSRPGATLPFQACCESAPAVFLSCPRCHAEQVAEALRVQYGCCATSHTTSSGDNCLHDWSTEQWAKQLAELKTVLLFPKLLYVKLYRSKNFKNRSLLYRHKHHFFVLLLS